MSAPCKALKGRITGVVQGVFFRASTAREAQRLGIKGWVRNTAAGDVEFCVCGAEPQLGEMVSWLHEGPSRARVRSVELEAVEIPIPDDFQIIG